MTQSSKWMALIRSTWFVIAVALLVRLAIQVATYYDYRGREAYIIGTEIGRIARAIVEGNGFSSPFFEPTGPTAWIAPVYPYLLAGSFKLFGVHTFNALMGIVALNCVLSAATVAPIAAIARRTFSERTAIASMWLWALLPSLITFPVRWVWETSLSALLLALIVLATLRVAAASQLRDGILWGTLCGVAALTNPSLIAPMPFLWLWAVRREGQARASLKAAVVALGVLAAIVTPWLIRNYVVFGQLVFIRSNAGVELYLGNNREVEASWAFWLHPSESLEETAKFRALGEMRYSAEKQREALRYIVEHPGKFVRLTLNRFVYFWTGAVESLADVWTGTRLWPALNATAYALLGLMGMVGLVVATRAGAPGATLFAIVLLTYPLVYYVTHEILRFRHPLDPLLVILAVVAMGGAIQRVRKRTPVATDPMLADRTI